MGSPWLRIVLVRARHGIRNHNRPNAIATNATTRQPVRVSGSRSSSRTGQRERPPGDPCDDRRVHQSRPQSASLNMSGSRYDDSILPGRSAPASEMVAPFARSKGTLSGKNASPFEVVRATEAISAATAPALGPYRWTHPPQFRKGASWPGSKKKGEMFRIRFRFCGAKQLLALHTSDSREAAETLSQFKANRSSRPSLPHSRPWTDPV